MPPRATRRAWDSRRVPPTPSARETPTRSRAPRRSTARDQSNVPLGLAPLRREGPVGDVGALDVDVRQSLPQPAHERRQVRQDSLGHVDRDAVAHGRGRDAEGHGPIQVAVLADDVVQHLLQARRRVVAHREAERGRRLHRRARDDALAAGRRPQVREELRARGEGRLALVARRRDGGLLEALADARRELVFRGI